ncbi:MAG: hypothetical protein ACXVGE_22425, partial [Blastococcus sp.]
MTTPVTADQLAAAQAHEYGQYVAAEPIYVGGSRAFNPGDPVPASHVDRGVVNVDQVVKTSTKAGKALAAG